MPGWVQTVAEKPVRMVQDPEPVSPKLLLHFIVCRHGFYTCNIRDITYMARHLKELKKITHWHEEEVGRLLEKKE